MKMVEEQGDTTELVLNTSVPEQTADINSSANETSTIFVHVCGAVKRPGVYELDEGARVCDAINAASGFKKKADDTKINQAQLLTDGEQIVVPYCSSNREDFSEQDAMLLKKIVLYRKLGLSVSDIKKIFNCPDNLTCILHQSLKTDLIFT